MFIRSRFNYNSLLPDPPAYSLRDKPHGWKAKEEVKLQSKTFPFAPCHPSSEQFKSQQQLDPLPHALFRYYTRKDMPKDKRMARKVDKYRKRTKVSQGIVLIEANSHAPAVDKKFLVFVPQ